jgi:hypothetical protein
MKQLFLNSVTPSSDMQSVRLTTTEGDYLDLSVEDVEYFADMLIFEDDDLDDDFDDEEDSAYRTWDETFGGNEG